MADTPEAIPFCPELLAPQVLSVESSDLTDEVRTELAGPYELNLPNLYETILTGTQSPPGESDPMRPQQVRPPLPGRYTNRAGKRIHRSELLPLVDEWIAASQGKPRFIVQGGNRYISKYLAEIGIDASSVKIMSIDKAPLYNQLLTLLSPLERDALCGQTALDAIADLLPATILKRSTPPTRTEALKLVASSSVYCPFASITKDDNLHNEFAEAIRLIDTGKLPIPNIDAIQQLLKGTRLHRAYSEADELHFLDDLFYRGRTLYSLAAVVNVFGGDARAIRLTSICCDTKSKDITSPYHRVLNNSKLYPFENSIRTEQGYWQDIGDRHIFTDMGNYWDFLDSQTDDQESLATYIEWRSMIHEWYDAHVEFEGTEADMTLIGPLVWLQVYHEVFGLDLNIEKIIDQKGYRIGACVPFALLINRFVSQEESVEARLGFKSEIRSILSSVQFANTQNTKSFEELKVFYSRNKHAIDYRGLSFLFEADTLPESE